MPMPSKNRFTRKLLIVLALAYALFVVAISAIQYQRSSLIAHQDAIAEIGRLGNSTSSALAEAVWQFQTPLVMALLQGIVENSAVQSAVVLLPTGDLEYHKGGVQKTTPPNGAFQRVFQLSYQPPGRELQQLGKLVIYGDPKAINTRIRDQLFSNLENSVAIALAMLIVTQLLISQLLAKPLNKLAAQIEDLNADKMIEGRRVDLGRTRDDELGMLQDAFNGLGDRVAASHQELLSTLDSLQEAQSRLEQANQELESTVANRTRDLELTLERFRMAQRAGGIGVSDYDVALQIRYWSPEILDMLEVSADQMDSDVMALAKLIDPDDRERAIRLRRETIDGTANYCTDEFRIVTGKGRSKWLRTDTQIVRDESGRAVRLIGLYIDITPAKLAAQELHRAKELAEEASRMKSSFLANMSHEIRTPMNAIMGMTTLALQTELTAKQRNYLEKADSAAQGLLGVINDVLDFSKIEAGKLNFEKNPFLLEDVLAHLTDLSVFRAQDKGLELLFDIEPDTPTALVGDAMRLGQVLLNLVNNAIKFTSHGEVTLRIGCIERNDSDCIMVFAVKDTGIGMTQQQRANLFTAFQQADSSTTRQYGGTGLGLSISEKMVELMDGKISVDTKLGAGSTFTFTARLGLQPQKDQPRLAVGLNVQHLKILVVDDNDSAREIMLSILVSLKLQATAVDNAQACIAALEAAHAQHAPYDLVLMDWQMPDMNGLDAIRSIRARSGIAQTTTFVMVTAYSRDELLAQAQDVKIEGFLEKPVTPSSVLNAIMTACSGNAGVMTRRHKLHVPYQETATQLDGASILLVEDNDINQELAIDILTGAGMRVDVANNGAEAVTMVGNRRYDAVLMDCQMPVMDGFEATVRIRRDARFAALPILAMSASAMAGDRERCVAAGMNDHIPKPIEIDKLFMTLARWIGSRTRPTSADADNEQARTIPHIAGLDSDAGLRQLNDNLPLYRKLLAQFTTKQADAVDRIRDAYRTGETDQALRLAHTLKGLAGNIGAGELSKAALAVELALGQHEYAGIGLLLAQLEKLLQAQVAAIEHAIAMQAAQPRDSD